MILTLRSLRHLADLEFDDVIDVRAPAEFAQDRLPGAINLPALDDDQRARVGTIYVQQDRFVARKIGAAMLARNVAAHLDGALADRDGGWRPLVYCWRGGQRSGGFATILEQIGWRVVRLDGGYKRYRRLVVDMLYKDPLPHRLILVAGGTGTGKTAVLARLEAAGAQVVDLEALAAHRGSLFGAEPGGQPAQKLFETGLAARLAACDPARPVFIEAESNKIGRLTLPPALWDAMKSAEAVVLDAPLGARAAFLTRQYGERWGPPERLLPKLDALRPFHPADRIAQWQIMARKTRLEPLVADLIRHHYDPRYAMPGPARAAAPVHVALPDLSDASLDAACATVLAQVTR
ncbi:MAG: tRNA 2-selenouridine(34) synthase MnmH [Rhodobacteraceae bacterium]|nr:tRNA 2-selenouridine(34) synthase MnmH [Paracoccaceae bacterium]